MVCADFKSVGNQRCRNSILPEERIQVTRVRPACARAIFVLALHVTPCMVGTHIITIHARVFARARGCHAFCVFCFCVWLVSVQMATERLPTPPPAEETTGAGAVATTSAPAAAPSILAGAVAPSAARAVGRPEDSPFPAVPEAVAFVASLAQWSSALSAVRQGAPRHPTPHGASSPRPQWQQ